MSQQPELWNIDRLAAYLGASKSFVPHPALGPSAAPLRLPLDSRDVVSTLTRPSGRVLPLTHRDHPPAEAVSTLTRPSGRVLR